MVSFNTEEKHSYSFLAWQLVLFAAICWTAIESPLSFVLNVPAKESNLWWDGIISFLFVCDIALNLSGFYKIKDTSNVLEPWKKEERTYHKTLWFVTDVISSIPFDVLAHVFGFTALPILRLFRLLRTVRMLKIVTLYNSMALLTHGYKAGMIL